jgi:hypothetical protein
MPPKRFFTAICARSNIWNIFGNRQNKIEKIPVMAKGITIKRYRGRSVSFALASVNLSKNAVLTTGKK